MRKLAFVASLVGIGVAAQAQAASITLDLSVHFGNGSASGGVSATITDIVGGVRVTMDASGLSGDEDVTEWFFNIDDGNVDLTLLDATYVPNVLMVSVGSVGTTSVSFGSNLFQADGDGRFDVNFDFPPPGDDKFSAGEIIVFDIDGDDDLDALDFYAPSAPGGGLGPFLSAAHIQSTGPGAEDSDWVGAVPEPSSTLLFGVGCLVAGIAAQRKR